MEFRRCRREDCFANKDGKCLALSDTRFNGKCPFYRNDLKFEEQDKAAREYLGKLDGRII